MAAFDFLASFRANVSELSAAYYAADSGYVYVWPEYWLGVKFNADVCHGVRVDQATVVSRRDNRVFTNGHGKRAVLMPRNEALRGALDNAKAILEKFEAGLIAA